MFESESHRAIRLVGPFPKRGLGRAGEVGRGFGIVVPIILNSSSRKIESLPFSNEAKWSIHCKWVFPKIGVPQNGWFTMENPIKMDDLGVSLFLETPIYCWNPFDSY